MPTEFTAQNGAVFNQSTAIKVSGCKKAPSRHQKLLKALKACKKKHATRRKSCERSARRRFGGRKG